MTQSLSVVSSLSQSPAGIEAELGRVGSDAIGVGDQQFGGLAIEGHTKQHQVVVAALHPQTVAQAQILTRHADGVTVAVNAATANAAEVEVQQ